MKFKNIKLKSIKMTKANSINMRIKIMKRFNTIYHKYNKMYIIINPFKIKMYLTPIKKFKIFKDKIINNIRISKI